MKIKSIKVSNFKRFSNLHIAEIPETVRIVILCGPNGCGKSSLFEAIYTWHRHTWRGDGGWDATYHPKQMGAVSNGWRQDVSLTFHDPQPATKDEQKKAIYIRSAYRNDPEFNVRRLESAQPLLEEVRFQRLIDNDAAVGKNYHRLASQGLEDIYERENPTTTIGEFRDKTIGEIRKSILRLFPDLELNSLGNPLNSGTFKFNKGNSKGFLYKNLSGGEKAAFDLVLDLIIRQREFDNTVFCIDEPEAHMNTRLQGELLAELYRIVPPSSQLWLSTHSVGMMRKAWDLEKSHPGTVVFLDFDGHNFDDEITLVPVLPNRLFWQRVLNVALDDLAELVAPAQIVICEGSPTGSHNGRNQAHDARCLDTIFADEFPDTRFLSGGSAKEVESDRLALLQAIKVLLTGSKITRVIDRDDRSTEEVDQFRSEGIRVLSRRHLECYLFDEEVLTELCRSVGKSEKSVDLCVAKNLAMERSIQRGNPPDDVKSASGEIYTSAKQLLNLVGAGNDAKSFMRSTLAPLLNPSMAVYRELRADIFG